VVGAANKEPWRDRVRSVFAFGGRKAHVAPAAGVDATRGGNGLRHVSVALPQPPPGGTVNDDLLAAAHWAIGRWNDERGKPGGRLSCTMPVNLRPDAWRFEIVGNFTVSAGIVTDGTQRTTPEAAGAAVVPQTTRAKEYGTAAGVFRLPAPVLRALPALFPLIPASSQPTATVSNLGVTEPIDFGPAGATTALWFSPPTIMPMGFVVGAASMAGELRLSFRWRTALLDDAGADRLIGLYLDGLAAF
jgi:NRPS condensation-like uncharacterized protein